MLQPIIQAAEKAINSASVLQVGSQARPSPWMNITSKKRSRGDTTAAQMPPWNTTNPVRRPFNLWVHGQNQSVEKTILKPFWASWSWPVIPCHVEALASAMWDPKKININIYFNPTSKLGPSLGFPSPNFHNMSANSTSKLQSMRPTVLPAPMTDTSVAALLYP